MCVANGIQAKRQVDANNDSTADLRCNDSHRYTEWAGTIVFSNLFRPIAGLILFISLLTVNGLIIILKFKSQHNAIAV